MSSYMESTVDASNICRIYKNGNKDLHTKELIRLSFLFYEENYTLKQVMTNLMRKFFVERTYHVKRNE